MSDLMKIVEKSQVRKTIPEFQVGSTVKVLYRIVEGEKERIQPFVGVVISKHRGKNNANATFTVRKVTQGHGVERTFPLHSPRVENVEVMKVGAVRQAKLYYLRELSGKAARIKERLGVSTKSSKSSN
ncbi:MAG: 50S ribosomal protein L19 [SAR324 cluster bacterium]|nr:50S ribosomal protein L19 [SAR324 cluster bacterium]MBF0350038.1 50S ribosomal protein L19 [SAR324 cluster bacterium]